MPRTLLVAVMGESVHKRIARAIIDARLIADNRSDRREENEEIRLFIFKQFVQNQTAVHFGIQHAGTIGVIFKRNNSAAGNPRGMENAIYAGKPGQHIAHTGIIADINLRKMHGVSAFFQP